MKRAAAFCFAAIANVLSADDLDDFEPIAIDAPQNAQEQTAQTQTAAKENSALSLSGSIAAQSAYQLDATNAADHIRQARLKGAIEAKYAARENLFFKLSADAFFEGAADPAAKSGAELSEAFMQARLGAADVKIGRQFVVWGKSDMLRVTDAINPLDTREPAMSDIGDLRLGVAMARFDLYAQNWDFQAIVIPEVRFSKRPNAPSEFAPIDLSDSAKPKGTQGAIAAIGVFEGWDLSLYGASLYRDEFRDHKRANMAGAAAGIAIGAAIIKGEAAFWDGGDFEREDYLLGFEYSGFSDTTIALEAQTRREDKTHSETYAARLTREFFNARLKLSLLGALNAEADENGGFARAQGDYEIADDLTLTIGCVAYYGDLAPYGFFKDNDRVFARLKASF
jgi:hypothetical protein